MLRSAKKKLRKIREPLQIASALQRPNKLTWHFGAPCPIGIYDASSARVLNSLYLLGGYTGLDDVSDVVHIYDAMDGTWKEPLSQPPDMANSHAAVATDAIRFIYSAGGQCGPQCRPANSRVYALDTKTKDWARLPDLPSARYAGTMQYWDGRLHFIGGADKDRWTPCGDHWSIAVCDGQATENSWQFETPIPVPGMHRGSVLHEDSLYVMGGQQGDFVAIEGDPEYTCTKRTKETYLSECFRLDKRGDSWTQIADLPIAASHTDFSVVSFDGKILVVGGQVYKHPEKFYLRLTDALQVFDPCSAQWSIFSSLPYPLKLPCAAVFRQKLICVGGQRSRIGSDRPGPVSSDVLELDLHKESQPVYALPKPNGIAGKSILAVSHDFSRTGGPLLLLETAKMLEAAGAQVRVVDASHKARGKELSAEFEVPVIPFENSFGLSAEADIVIANTLHDRTKSWVKECSQIDPNIFRRLLWWVHEIDVQHFRRRSELVEKSAAVIFDSDASRMAWTDAIGLPKETTTIYPAFSERFLTNMRENKECREVLRKQLDVASDDFLVCSIGTVGARKGQSPLCRTLAKLALNKDLPIKILLVGFDGRRKKLQFFLTHWFQGRRVISKRRLISVTADYARYFLASDVIVVNSQGRGRGENFGRVTTEAMAYGLPVLGTNAGGTGEIICHGENGLLYPVGANGQQELARLIEKLLQDRDYARSLGSCGQQYALEAYHPKRFMKEFEEVVSLF